MKYRGSNAPVIIGIIVSWLIAAGIGWLIFGLAAPALCSLIPAGTYKGILDVVIYLAVAATGGVGLPLGVGIFGSKMAVEVLG